MDTITLYELPEFGGDSREICYDIDNLEDLCFQVSSAKVSGMPWILYEDPFYHGSPRALEEGEYPNMNMRTMAASLMQINDDLKDPQITIYEKPNHVGPPTVVTEETNLTETLASGRALSHVVQKGVWILYENGDTGGDCIVARVGFIKDYQTHRVNNGILYVRPLRSGSDQ